jgi:hypothetical protein
MFLSFFVRFLIRFTGQEEQINLLGDGSERPEFGAYSWMSPEEVIERVCTFISFLLMICFILDFIYSWFSEQAVEFKKPVYEEVLKHFAPHLKSDSMTDV